MIRVAISWAYYYAAEIFDFPTFWLRAHYPWTYRASAHLIRQSIVWQGEDSRGPWQPLPLGDLGPPHRPTL